MGEPPAVALSGRSDRTRSVRTPPARFRLGRMKALGRAPGRAPKQPFLLPFPSSFTLPSRRAEQGWRRSSGRWPDPLISPSLLLFPPANLHGVWVLAPPGGILEIALHAGARRMKMVRSPGAAPGSAPWHGAVFLLDHDRKSAPCRRGRDRLRQRREVAGLTRLVSRTRRYKEQMNEHPCSSSEDQPAGFSRRLFGCFRHTSREKPLALEKNFASPAGF